MKRASISEIAKIFLKQGIIGFGGPAVHIAMMEEEVVNRREWLDREHFLDLLGATNLIPGPNSTEMAIHIGYNCGGLPGLIVAGFSFILPAAIITGILAAIYTQFGSLPQVTPLLAGIKPVVLSIILAALWRLGKKAIKNRYLLIIAIVVAGLLLWGVNQIVALIFGGLLTIIWQKFKGTNTQMILTALGMGEALTVSVATSTPTITPSLWQLGLFFLKIGSVLFGTGYVLIAFLQGELVDNYGWLTQQQLLDAIAIGQFTPGPILSTATFIGYIILGIPGAIIATLGIFVPSFFLVIAVNPLIPKMRQSKWTGAFLDGVNVSALALMAVVTIELGWTTLFQPINIISIIIAILAAVGLLIWRLNPAWLVLSGGIIGGLASWF